MLRKRIEHLRQQPEHIRARYASFAALGAGGILVILWAAVLLPAQLRWGPGGGNPEPAVAGITTTPVPVSERPTISPSPAPEATLPLSE